MPALTGDKPVMASGTVTLTMIVNLKRFVKRGYETNGAGIDLFEQVRGTKLLADYLHALPEAMQSPFVLDDAEEDLLETAHQLRIFRGYVVSQYFFPAYRLDEDAFLARPDLLASDQVLVATFPTWDYQVTITRNGFAVVRMVRHFDDELLSVIASEIQEVERSHKEDREYSESRSSWRIAMDVTAAVLEAMGGHMDLIGHDHKSHRILFDPEQRRGRLPLHDRYTTMQLTHVHRAGKTIAPDQFITEYGSFALGLMRLATALRGGVAHDMRRRRPVHHADLLNLSPWQDDLCLVTNDAMLTYTQTAETAGAGSAEALSSRAEFWQGVGRGVEWLVNVKTEWQLLERQSTEMLSTVSGLTARVNDGLLDEEDRVQLRILSQSVAQAFNMLPEVRYALVPASVTHATDVVLVYAHLLEQLGVYRIADHVNANVEELNAFLTYYSSTQLQFETREQEETENRTGLTISIMLILLSLVSVPSLIKDASEIDWTLVQSEPTWQLISVIGLAMLPFVLLFTTIWYVFRNLNRHRY